MKSISKSISGNFSSTVSAAKGGLRMAEADREVDLVVSATRKLLEKFGVESYFSLVDGNSLAKRFEKPGLVFVLKVFLDMYSEKLTPSVVEILTKRLDLANVAESYKVGMEVSEIVIPLLEALGDGLLSGGLDKLIDSESETEVAKPIRKVTTRKKK